MTKRKRALAIVLTCIMVLTLIPIQANAAKKSNLIRVNYRCLLEKHTHQNYWTIKVEKNIPNYASWVNPSIINQYNNYGVYATVVDGVGQYTFNNVKVGDYKIIIISNRTPLVLLLITKNCMLQH